MSDIQHSPPVSPASVSSWVSTVSASAQPLEGFSSYVSSAHSALVAVRTPRLVNPTTGTVDVENPFARAATTPRAEFYTSDVTETVLTGLPALPTGTTHATAFSMMTEMPRMQAASIRVHSPHLWDTKPVSFWRKYCMAVSAVRLGAYHFLGSLPNVSCPTTRAMEELTADGLKQTASVPLWTLEAHEYAKTRASIPRPNSHESAAMEKFWKMGPEVFSAAAAFYTKQISAYAFNISCAELRGKTRAIMTPWEHRSLGLDTIEIWQLITIGVVTGFNQDYVFDVTMESTYSLALLIHKETDTTTKFRLLADFVNATTGRPAFANSKVDPAETSDEALADDNISVVDEADHEPLVVPSSPFEAVKGTGLAYDFSKGFPTKPASVLGVVTVDDEDEGFE